MPYRRLPNTDKARLRALSKAHNMLELEGPKNVPYTESTCLKLKSLFPKFKSALVNLEASRKNQAQKNKEYNDIFRKARMYVSHYIQVMNFAINRGELKPAIREFYGTETFENNLPPLNSDEHLLEWGKKIIEGDQQRIMNGGNPFYNPSIALVKVNFEKFVDAQHFQKNLQATSERGATLVSELRTETDDLILQIWNTCEAHFEDQPDVIKREKAEKYGVVYVMRKSEKNRIEAQKKQPQFNF